MSSARSPPSSPDASTRTLADDTDWDEVDQWRIASASSRPTTPPLEPSIPMLVTPAKHNPGGSERHSTNEGSFQDNTIQNVCWNASLAENFRGEIDVDDFLARFFPAPSAESLDFIKQCSEKAAADLNNAAKDTQRAKEKKMTPKILTYLNAVVSDFTQFKPHFLDTQHTRIPPIHGNDHSTAPDIVSTRPGWEHVDKQKLEWPFIGAVLELKLKIDIFDENGFIKEGQNPQSALVQIAKNARSLLACDRLFSFVVTVFSKKARILRFDRTGFHTSTAFDWTSQPMIMPGFLFRLFNPETCQDGQARMSGDDETVTTPTENEKLSMYQIWEATSSYPKSPHLHDIASATRHSRWIEAELDDKTVLCFSIGAPLYQSDGLFGRGTRVDRVIIKNDPSRKVYALKHSWRQACRRPEIDFYDVLRKYGEENDASTAAMARCLGSVEFHDHRTISVDDETQRRYHVRSLITPVGTPLKHFTSSKSLLYAVQNAINHHEIASKAGIIHRDPSEGNILFDELTGEGFLADWDYAEFNSVGVANFGKWFPERAGSESNKMYMEVDKSLRELTGTFPFRSIELLEKKQVKHQSYHDLESFYWLFVWIILRYTDHTHKRKDFACHILFDAEKPEASKRNWLLKPTPLADSPLYKVTEALRSLVMHQNPVIAEETVPHPSRPPLPAPEPAFINYEYVKWAFDLAIKAPIWTNFQDSPAKVFHPPSKKKAGPNMHAQLSVSIQQDPMEFGGQQQPVADELH
ncbi:hypothetical protein C8R45DRAFT_854840 [Mycena sanguinolenta]|nr:hypothetical protein C8R45DRAFT_854840 [Mycena sanguinolenta]